MKTQRGEVLEIMSGQTSGLTPGWTQESLHITGSVYRRILNALRMTLMHLHAGFK